MMTNRSSAFGGAKPFLLSDAPDQARMDLAAVLGGPEAVFVAGVEALNGWPDYVAARARTGGAVVAERDDDAAHDPRFMTLADGVLDGRPAVAGLVAGALVFVLQPESTAAIAAAA